MIRYIHMMTSKKEQIPKIEKWCQEKDVPFRLKSAEKYNYKNFYYFSVRTDTAGYEMLKAEFPEIHLTDVSHLGNVLDCDDEVLQEFLGILNSYQYSLAEVSKSDEWFKNFILKLDSPEKLEAVKDFSNYISKHGERLLEERICFFKGQPDDYEQFLEEKVISQNQKVKQPVLTVGDIVYEYDETLQSITEYNISKIVITKNGSRYWATRPDDAQGNLVSFTEGNIGFDIALTKTEAETAIARKMEDEHGKNIL